jgi:hypothetical protein
MKWFSALVITLLVCVPSVMAGSVQLTYAPGNIWATSVSDTTTAGGLTYLRGSRQTQVDIQGNVYTSTAFQIQAVDSSLNSMDFYYSYSSNPNVTGNLWKGSVWGPMQRDMTLPGTGFYVSPTFTASGSIAFTFETMQ